MSCSAQKPFERLMEMIGRSDMEDPATEVSLKMPNVAFRLKDTPGKIRFPGLPIGSAYEVIIKDLLGYNEDQILNTKKN